MVCHFGVVPRPEAFGRSHPVLLTPGVIIAPRWDAEVVADFGRDHSKKDSYVRLIFYIAKNVQEYYVGQTAWY